jgi:hypothetical protein
VHAWGISALAGTLHDAAAGSPLLPASATGTVDTHSIVDPIRSHLDARCNYYEAEAMAIDPIAKRIDCAFTRPFRDAATPAQRDHAFSLDYDVLVIAVRKGFLITYRYYLFPVQRMHLPLLRRMPLLGWLHACRATALATLFLLYFPPIVDGGMLLHGNAI